MASLVHMLPNQQNHWFPLQNADYGDKVTSNLLALRLVVAPHFHHQCHLLVRDTPVLLRGHERNVVRVVLLPQSARKLYAAMQASSVSLPPSQALDGSDFHDLYFKLHCVGISKVPPSVYVP